MYAHTESFKVLKNQTQEILDFAVLIDNSVPLLKMTIKNIEKKVDGINLANPDFFTRPPDNEQLKNYAKEYKNNLSKYVLLSNFSYFEAYVINSIEEIFEFHGGFDNMLKASQLRCNQHIDSSNDIVKQNKRKLQDSYDKKKKEKYEKYSNLLKQVNYKFPSELLSSYGIMKLKEELKNLKSIGIPDILINGLHLFLSDDDIKEFHRIRDIRNSIAHGKNQGFNMKSAMKCNTFLRDLSVKIDKHIVNNYFVIERFS
jgi:hypothetical protein